MKLGPVTKLDKRNKMTSKKLDDYVMSAIAIRKLDSGRIVCKIYIFIKSNVLSHKI